MRCYIVKSECFIISILLLQHQHRILVKGEKDAIEVGNGVGTLN